MVIIFVFCIPQVAGIVDLPVHIRVLQHRGGEKGFYDGHPGGLTDERILKKKPGGVDLLPVPAVVIGANAVILVHRHGIDVPECVTGAIDHHFHRMLGQAVKRVYLGKSAIGTVVARRPRPKAKLLRAGDNHGQRHQASDDVLDDIKIEHYAQECQKREDKEILHAFCIHLLRVRVLTLRKDERLVGIAECLRNHRHNHRHLHASAIDAE